MIIGIIPNIAKDRIIKVVEDVVHKITESGFDYLISESLSNLKSQLSDDLNRSTFLPHKNLCEKSDLLVSIGGDGTMLNTAFEARHYGTPMASVCGLTIGPPVESEYPVEPVGVAIIKPSAEKVET